MRADWMRRLRLAPLAFIGLSFALAALVGMLLSDR